MQNIGLSTFRSFVTNLKGDYNVNRTNEDEQARFADSTKSSLTSRTFRRTQGYGISRHSNHEMRLAFRNAIESHLRVVLGKDTVFSELQKALGGDFLSNKPLTKRQIQNVLLAVDRIDESALEGRRKNCLADLDKLTASIADKTKGKECPAMEKLAETYRSKVEKLKATVGNISIPESEGKDLRKEGRLLISAKANLMDVEGQVMKLKSEFAKRADEETKAWNGRNGKYLNGEGKLKPLLEQEGIKGLPPGPEKIEKINELIRKEIIPNLMPKLESRMTELQNQTVKALGFAEELTPWVLASCPQLDVKSDKFMDIVRQEISTGGDLKTLEDKILDKCRPKDTYEDCLALEGESKSYTFVLTKPKSAVNDEKFIVVDEFKGVDGFEANINNQAKMQNFNVGELVATGETPISNLLNRAEDMQKASKNLQACITDKNLDGIVDEVMDTTLKDAPFTEDERKSIKETLTKSVIDPIMNAKDGIWNVKPLKFMNHLIDHPGNNPEEMREVISEVVSGIVQRNYFQASEPKVNGEKLIDVNSRMDQEENLSAHEVIEKAINEKKGLNQKGGTNCFMVSIVNALLTNKAGQDVLRDCFTGDGKYYFKDLNKNVFSLDDDSVNAKLKKYEGAKGMSKLERAIWAAWLSCVGEDTGNNIPGRQCPAAEFAFLFGLEVSSTSQDEPEGVNLPGSRLRTWASTKNHLDKGQFALVHTGNENDGHYRALTEATVDGGDEKAKKFTCCDSLKEKAESKFEIGGLKSEEDKNGDGRIILLSLTKP